MIILLVPCELRELFSDRAFAVVLCLVLWCSPAHVQFGIQPETQWDSYVDFWSTCFVWFLPLRNASLPLPAARAFPSSSRSLTQRSCCRALLWAPPPYPEIQKLSPGFKSCSQETDLYCLLANTWKQVFMYFV